jgi:chromosome segregation ATPase
MPDPDKPPEHPTTKLDQIEILKGLISKQTQAISEGFAHQEERFAKVEAAVDMLVEDGKSANMRVTKLELRLEEFDQRATKNSYRVRENSQLDASQDAMIAKLSGQVEAVDKKVAAVDEKVASVAKEQTAELVARMDRIIANPAVKMLGTLLLGLLTGWLASKGVKLP